MSHPTNYRRVQGPVSGQGELPPATGTQAPRMGLREYWRAKEILHTTGSNQLRRLLRQALDRLSVLEGWGAKAGLKPQMDADARR